VHTSEFGQIVSAFEEIQKETKPVFPIHPRTRDNIKGGELEKQLKAMLNLLLEPLGYLDFLCLMSNAAVAITDSGGIQEETTILGIPCMTLRDNTERPVTITEGTNRLVHVSTENVVRVYSEIKVGSKNVHHRRPKLWDGKAAQRVARIIAEPRSGLNNLSI
jgi:UDP-N-acetylglucosamine 2-epimerase (non-hydrolysing)